MMVFPFLLFILDGYAKMRKEKVAPKAIHHGFRNNPVLLYRMLWLYAFTSSNQIDN